MAKLLTYSPKDVIILLGGVYSVEYLAESDFVSISHTQDTSASVAALDGEEARVHRQNNHYTIEISLQQSSPTNNYLSVIYEIDQKTGLGKMPLLIKDDKGTSIFFATTCWVESRPDLTFSNTLNTRKWVLGCSEAGMVVGGNVESTVLDILGIATVGSELLGNLGVFGG